MNQSEYRGDVGDEQIEHSGSRGMHGHGMHGHGWMMIACCIPMIVIAAVLVATGVASASALLVALACLAMMTLMMRGMSGGGHDHR